MAKLTLRKLKRMIREAVQEQISGGINVQGQARNNRSTGFQRSSGGGNPWMTGNFSLDQLVAAMKDEADPAQIKLIKQAVMAKLKAVGW